MDTSLRSFDLIPIFSLFYNHVFFLVAYDLLSYHSLFLTQS